MPSSCYVQMYSNYANRNAGISLHLNLIENKNRVVWVWFVNTYWAHFDQMWRFVIFQRILVEMSSMCVDKSDPNNSIFIFYEV